MVKLAMGTLAMNPVGKLTTSISSAQSKQHLAFYQKKSSFKNLLADNPRSLNLLLCSASALAIPGIGPSLSIDFNYRQPTYTVTRDLERFETFPSNLKIGELLGAGANGEVKAVLDVHSKQQYAVKVLPKANYSGRKRSAALRREVALWKKICAITPYGVNLEGVYEDSSMVYFVQELCVGGTLQDLLTTQGPLSEAELASVAYSLLSFLADLHKHGVLHGDVKPHNFLIKNLYPCVSHILNPSLPKGDIKLKAIDFGSCQLASSSTLLSQMVGSPLYAAPEVLRRAYSIPSDIWSAGVIMYQLASNRLPFWVETIESLDAKIELDDLCSSIQQSPVILVGECWEKRSPPFLDFLCKLLDKNPHTRLRAEDALMHPWLQLHGF